MRNGRVAGVRHNLVRGWEGEREGGREDGDGIANVVCLNQKVV